MVFVKEAGAGALNKNQTFGSLKYPELLALDSKGYLHHFRYFDGALCPILPRLKHLLSRDEFFGKQEFLKAKLTLEKRSRAKSQYQKCEITPPVDQNKKLSKSLMRRALLPEEIKAL